ncbi:hypothetical protein CR205_07235 [Alteribacter lacisalsi]|uniref:DUF2515 domain-containing protein n=1 Tax=Alteribacter lacisalsi TaxID=2045244 RepID=A0A2W0HNC2_9BACI|nr:DUF2515 family protein [Alteribacter lacisalsi]PYZ98379.1 hypothetical protein CR205_07235 [Alteribacter lacisalsi]
MLKDKDKKILYAVKKEIESENYDNISRTEFYQKYYKRNPEIRWSYLASMVSRNAGWAMTDLKSRPFCELLQDSLRMRLFQTYERANWMIFSDACAQLLIYEWSKKEGAPYFHLLPQFGVSNWITEKWLQFWQRKDEEELLVALIVNEQNLIEKPVIKNHFDRHSVFGSSAYKLQDRLHFSTVLFPDTKGNLFGCSVHDFTKTKKRISLGRKLAWILFESPEKEDIMHFHDTVTPTGSRRDYQQFLERRYPKTPILRFAYGPVIHQREMNRDWSKTPGRHPNRDLRTLKPITNYSLLAWYEGKLEQLEAVVSVERLYQKVLGRLRPHN